MWTRDELTEIRNRAELEASIPGLKASWVHACLDLAAAADRLDSFTSRIERGEDKAVVDGYTSTGHRGE